MSEFAVADVAVDGQQNYDDVFPLVLAAQGSGSLDDARQWVRSQRERLLESLSRHGAILFRGFAIRDANDFDSFIRAFELESFTYDESFSNAVRVNCTELVFTANEAPPDVSIYLHHEMAQTPLFPSRLFFCCEIAPSSAGETPLCRSDVLLERLQVAEPEFVENCEKLGIRYSNVMPVADDAESGQGRSWRNTLNVADRAEAESRLDSMGYRYEWLDDESLRATTQVMPAIRTLANGRRVFFNQLIAAFRGWQEAEKSVWFGDDTPIPPASMHTACRLADELSFDLPWQAGDVALVDNFLVMHGRRPFAGKRRVLVSLVADDGKQLAA